jgi:hypothetical protein
MSAFDITGAVIFAVLLTAVAFAEYWLITHAIKERPTIGRLLIVGIFFLAGFVFCLARILGAHL